MSDQFRVGFPTLPALTDPNFSGALQRDIDDLSKGLGGVIATGQSLTAVTSWTAATLLNSWVNYGAPLVTARYTKDATGTVYVQGTIKNGTTANGTNLFTLPVGYRPIADLLFAMTTSAGIHAELFVQASTGSVGISNGGAVAAYLSLSGITFKAEQ